MNQAPLSRESKSKAGSEKQITSAWGHSLAHVDLTKILRLRLPRFGFSAEGNSTTILFGRVLDVLR